MEPSDPALGKLTHMIGSKMGQYSRFHHSNWLPAYLSPTKPADQCLLSGEWSRAPICHTDRGKVGTLNIPEGFVCTEYYQQISKDFCSMGDSKSIYWEKGNIFSFILGYNPISGIWHNFWPLLKIVFEKIKFSFIYNLCIHFLGDKPLKGFH